MSGQPLLHSSLNPRVTKALIAIGVFVVLVGAANLVSRLANTALGPNSGTMLFGPAVALNNPALLNSLTASSSFATVASHPIVPARLLIPSIGVDAKVGQVGKKADGTMGAPQNFTDVAWYALGSQPGASGNAVIAGHVNNALTTAGVFAHLSQIGLGAKIIVSDADGRTLSYTVISVQSYPADAETPSVDDSIFATSGPSQLVLITCGGDWVPDEHQFNERLVVFAALAQ